MFEIDYVKKNTILLRRQHSIFWNPNMPSNRTIAGSGFPLFAQQAEEARVRQFNTVRIQVAGDIPCMYPHNIPRNMHCSLNTRLPTPGDAPIHKIDNPEARWSCVPPKAVSTRPRPPHCSASPLVLLRHKFLDCGVVLMR